MDKRDADLELHHRTWTIDGDLYRCRFCQRGCLASKAGEKFIHASDCSVKDTACDYPWMALAEMTAAVANPHSHAERQRLTAIIERYPNGDPLEYNAAVKEVSKIIGIERMPPMEYDEP